MQQQHQHQSSGGAVIKYWLYVILGIGAITTSTLLLLAIATSTKLRSYKEYVIIAGLATADLMEATATFVGGSYRSVIHRLLHSLINYDFICMCLCVELGYR